MRATGSKTYDFLSILLVLKSTWSMWDVCYCQDEKKQRTQGNGVGFHIICPDPVGINQNNWRNKWKGHVREFSSVSKYNWFPCCDRLTRSPHLLAHTQFKKNRRHLELIRKMKKKRLSSLLAELKSLLLKFLQTVFSWIHLCGEIFRISCAL